MKKNLLIFMFILITYPVAITYADKKRDKPKVSEQNKVKSKTKAKTKETKKQDAASTKTDNKKNKEISPKTDITEPDFTLYAGNGLKMIDSGMSITIGFPKIEFSYYFKVRPKIELAPSFGFFYGIGTTVPVIGNTLGCNVKINFMQKGKYKIFLFAEPALVAIYDPDVAAGIRIGAPGIKVTYKAFEKGVIIGGFKFSPILLFGKHFLLSLPMIFSIGGEFKVHKEFNLFVDMEFGPDIRKISGHATKAYLYVNTVFGLSKKF